MVMLALGLFKKTLSVGPEPGRPGKMGGLLARCNGPLTCSVSLKATPLRSAVALVFGLLMVKVIVLVPFRGILVGLNTLLMVGGPTTVKFAEAVFPVPPLPEDTLPVVFVYWPAVAPVTVTLTTH